MPRSQGRVGVSAMFDNLSSNCFLIEMFHSWVEHTWSTFIERAEDDKEVALEVWKLINFLISFFDFLGRQ